MTHILRIDEMVANDSNVLSDDIFKKNIIDGLYNVIDDVLVDVSMEKSFDKSTLPTLYISLGNNPIDRHSIYCFVFRLWDGKIDCIQTPYVYLSPFDKSGNNTYNPRLKYMAMRSADELIKECGFKQWRKTKYNTTDDIVSKVSTYVNECIKLLNIYCGCDVRKDTELRGVIDESILDAVKKES